MIAKIKTSAFFTVIFHNLQLYFLTNYDVHKLLIWVLRRLDT